MAVQLWTALFVSLHPKGRLAPGAFFAMPEDLDPGRGHNILDQAQVKDQRR